MRQWLSSSILFTSKMVFVALLSVLGLVFVLVIVARFDVAFFEANGMLQNADIREAFYYQIFQVDDVILGMLALGFLSVAAISFMFCKSQFDYYKRFAGAFRMFTENWEAPPTALMGRFNPYATYFFDIMSRRANGETEEGIEPLLARAGREWPHYPTVSWNDQLQFAAVSGVLGVFFSTCCVIFYLKVSGRVVELANRIVHFTNSSGPSFFSEQFAIVNLLVWTILLVTTASFIFAGFRFGRQISEADYAILRDLRAFVEGNYRQRLFLRNGDPAKEFIVPMNEALERIAERMRVPVPRPPTEQAAPAVPATPATVKSS